MENKEFIDRIRDMIAEGDTEKSLEELYHFVREADNELLDQLVMLKNRMKKVQRDHQNGTVDDETEFHERAKINEAILMCLRQMTPEYVALNKKETEQYDIPPAASDRKTPALPRNMNLVYIGGGAILLLAVVFFLLNKSTGTGSEAVSNSLSTNNLSTNTLYPKWAEVRTKSGDDLRIRVRPDENSDIVVNMPHGSKVKIIGTDGKYVTLKNGDYGKWFKVEYDDGDGTLRFGWAWGNFLALME